jgi:hypothetical protein
MRLTSFEYSHYLPETLTADLDLPKERPDPSDGSRWGGGGVTAVRWASEGGLGPPLGMV